MRVRGGGKGLGRAEACLVGRNEMLEVLIEDENNGVEAVVVCKGLKGK